MFVKLVTAVIQVIPITKKNVMFSFLLLGIFLKSKILLQSLKSKKIGYCWSTLHSFSYLKVTENKVCSAMIYTFN